MNPQRYTVKPGDTLWDISRRFLGSPYEWPRLWRYNNRPAVVARTGRGIPNPDLIYTGQRLLVPLLNRQPVPRPSPQPKRTDDGGTGLAEQVRRIRSPIAIKYALDDVEFPPILSPGAIMEMRMEGELVLTSRESYPATYVINRRELEQRVTQEANHAFGQLLSEVQLTYDAERNRLRFGANLVSKSRNPRVPATAFGVEMNSHSPLPKLRFEIRLPDLVGTIDAFNYAAAGVKVVVELTPRGQRGPTAQPLRPAPEPAVNWNKVIGTGLIIAGVAIVVGTLVEDFLTAGVGVADDPASFAAAGLSFSRGVALWGTAGVVMQQAIVPAVTQISVSVVPQGALQYAQ